MVTLVLPDAAASRTAVQTQPVTSRLRVNDNITETRHVLSSICRLVVTISWVHLQLNFSEGRLWSM